MTILTKAEDVSQLFATIFNEVNSVNREMDPSRETNIYFIYILI